MQPEGKAAATYSTATTEKESNLIFPRALERGRAKMGKERAEFVAGKKKPTPLFHTQLAYFPSGSGGEFRLFAILPRKKWAGGGESNFLLPPLNARGESHPKKICKN